MNLRALTTNFVFIDQLDFVPQGAGAVAHGRGRKQCAIVAGIVITCSEKKSRVFLDRNKRGVKKWEDVTSLCGLDLDDPHYIPTDPPIVGGEPREEDVEDEGPSDELEEFAGALAEPLHEAGFISFQEIANSTVESLSHVPGVGPATAEKLLSSAAEAVAEATRDNTGD